MSGMEDLQRLEGALRDVGAATTRAADLYAEIRCRYGEAHRAYHTMSHVHACLGQLDRNRAHAERPAEVELALWFHDVVYDPAWSDNEERSAALGASWLKTYGAPAEIVDRVAAMVVSTREHRSTTGDAALLASIDLAILGAPSEEYARFERAVRKEYAHVRDDAYRRGRATVLRGFLDRPQIYAFVPIRETLEAQARKNLASTLAALEQCRQRSAR